MNFVSIGGLVTHYVRSGPPDGLPLVFIHSLGTDLRLWGRLVPMLETDHPIVRYDLRGHGLSDCPPGPYRLSQQVADLAGLLAHLQIGAVALVGISIGGLIALEFAAKQPDAVRGLVLADTAPRIGSPDRWQQRIEAVQSGGLEPLVPTVLELWFSEAFRASQPALTQGFGNLLARTPAEGYVASCAVLIDSDLGPRLAAIGAPTLVLAGELDRVTSPEQCRALAAALHAGRFEPIPQAAHLPCIEQPKHMASLIRRFLQEQVHG